MATMRVAYGIGRRMAAVLPTVSGQQTKGDSLLNSSCSEAVPEKAA
ncbi:MAG TPA: hypothetical protein VMW86_07230 [Dehalococcoidales bacterium]|nr:hypothetical protein [Dehalococcoidales bacterium]